MKQTADTATTQLASVSTDVGTVKTDVQNTKSQLEQTIANLKRATGELDSHASLIATNGKELQALRELGERNYAEFTINKSKKPTRVGDVMLELKKADTEAQPVHHLAITCRRQNGGKERSEHQRADSVLHLESAAARRNCGELKSAKIRSSAIWRRPRFKRQEPDRKLNMFETLPCDIQNNSLRPCAKI